MQWRYKGNFTPKLHALYVKGTGQQVPQVPNPVNICTSSEINLVNVYLWF